MRSDPRNLLHDILNCCKAIRRFTGGRVWWADPLARKAVVRDYEIIVETMERLRNHYPELAGRIPDLPRITGFRYKLAYGHDGMDPETEWLAIIEELPALETSIQDLMTDPDPVQNKESEPGAYEATNKSEDGLPAWARALWFVVLFVVSIALLILVPMLFWAIDWKAIGSLFLLTIFIIWLFYGK